MGSGGNAGCAEVHLARRFSLAVPTAGSPPHIAACPMIDADQFVAFATGRYLSAALARAFAASASRFRGGAPVTRASSNSRAVLATSSTARSKAS
jgi:hypothetical protein